ncbi:MAG: hypothetical protein ACRECY_14750 [Phyllobacterium sp.]
MNRTLASLSAIAAACLMASPSSAALSPTYQRARELAQVIEAAVGEFSRYPIDKVVYQGEDRYTVVAGPCSLRAEIISKPLKQGLVGPRQFAVKLGKPRCR